MARRWVTGLAAAGALLVGASVAAEPASADSIRAQEWWLGPMHATEMWQRTTGAGVTVAVIDSGVQADHPDLLGQVLPGKNFSGLPGGAQTDANGHGTAMASLIAGTGKNGNGQGSIGLAPGVRILPLRIWGQGPNDAASSANYSPQLAAAVRYAADSDARIINLSQGQEEDVAGVREAIVYAESKGKLVVAAVGNNGDTGNPVNYPAAYPGVVGVAAFDESVKITAESESGPQVALAAPGYDMYSACTDGSGYCKGHGTSGATALVSASAALVWSVHPTWTADQVIRVLINTASRTGGWDPHFGWGVVRPRVALTNPGDPGPADVNPLTPAAATASTRPSAGASSPAASAPPVAAASGGKGGGNGLLYGGLGAVALLVVLAAGAFAVLRRRRGGDTAVAVGGPYGQSGSQVNQYAPGGYQHLPNPYAGGGGQEQGPYNGPPRP